MSRLLLEARSVSKRYEIYRRPSDRLKQTLWRGRRQFFTEFWALRDVTMGIEAGETLGLIGQNGAGKSTLLQILAGIIAPSSGEVQCNARVAAILELGAGFNPEFTGRENARLNAALLGIPAQRIPALLPDIESFADIGDFFDRPVKLYSSGMFARLAFAVASSVDPDVLIVDEALSVGDARFQAKCFRRLEQFQQSGKGIIFVTHSVDLIVRHCTRAILLDQGRVMTAGEPKDVVHTYLDLLFGTKRRVNATEAPSTAPDAASAATSELDDFEQFASNPSPDDRLSAHPAYNANEFRWGHGGAKIIDARMWVEGHAPNTPVVESDSLLMVAVLIRCERRIDSAIVGLTLRTPDGVNVAGTNSRDWRRPGTTVAAQAGEVVCATFRFMPRLGGGDYLLSLGIAENVDGDVRPLDRRYDCLAITVLNPGRTSGLADLGIEFGIRRAERRAVLPFSS